jgi:hypothetical protein
LARDLHKRTDQDALLPAVTMQSIFSPAPWHSEWVRTGGNLRATAVV